MSTENNTTALVPANGMSQAPAQVARRLPSYFENLERFNVAIQMATVIAKTELVPKQFRGDPAGIVVAWEMGAELGLSPLQALQNIAVINGRPTVWGDTLLAICMAQPSFVDIKEEISADGTKATCTVWRHGRKEPTIRTFTVDEAKQAGLWGGNVWKSYPRRMMQMRARAFALRDTWPDALRGMYAREEVIDSDTPLDVMNIQALPLALPLDSDPTAVLGFIEAAKTEKELAAVVTWAQDKSDDVAAAVRVAYKDRVNAIRRPPEGKASVKPAKDKPAEAPADKPAAAPAASKEKPKQEASSTEPPHNPQTGEVEEDPFKS